MAKTALYRLYDTSGQLLYVGIASNPEQRWTQHAADKPWWPEVVSKRVEWHPSREAALSAELTAIRSEHPKHNRNGVLPAGYAATIKDPERGGTFDPNLSPVDGCRLAVKELRSIADPLERALAAAELQEAVRETTPKVASTRQHAIRRMRLDGKSYRAIGDLLGIHHTRVKQLETGQSTGKWKKAATQPDAAEPPAVD